MLNRSQDDYVDLNRYRVVGYQHSLNQPQVSPGNGQPTTLASCGVFEVADEKRSLFFVGLYFPNESSRILYEMEVSVRQPRPDVLQEIDSFINELGFLMTDSKLSELNPQAQQQTLRLSPFVYKDIGLYVQGLSQSEVRFKREQMQGAVKKEVEFDSQKQFIDQYVTILSML